MRGELTWRTCSSGRAAAAAAAEVKAGQGRAKQEQGPPGVGTALYAAPEQISGAQVDAKADVRPAPAPCDRRRACALH